MRIEYHPALEGELREIRDYYDACSPGLGSEFVKALDRRVLEIASMPERWMLVTGDIRRSLLRRFPYVIYFRIIGPESIRITVVKHGKRHPGYGLERR